MMNIGWRKKVEKKYVYLGILVLRTKRKVIRNFKREKGIMYRESLAKYSQNTRFVDDGLKRGHQNF